MLQSIHIQNFAIIENIDLDFKQGFTVITGETGAGKSILIDAMGLVLGDRADNDQIRYGCDKADISAEFEANSNVISWLNDNDLDDESQCFIRRVIRSNGNSSAYINGQKASLNQVKELGEMLVEIHGQHEHQRLTDNASQLNILDGFAQLQTDVQETKQRYRHWHTAVQQLKTLQGDTTQREERIDYLRFQLDELEKLSPQAGEEVLLNQEHLQLANAEKTLNSYQQASGALYDGEVNAYSLLSHALNELEQVLEYSPDIQESVDLLNTAVIQTKEAADNLHRQADNVDLDPSRLQFVDERIAALQQTARKHQVEVEELPEKWQLLQDELHQLENADQQSGELEQQVEQLQQQYQQQAEQLSNKRQAAAAKLSSAVTQTLQPLGLPHGEFVCSLESLNSPTANGLETANFLVSMNPGQPPKPLRKVASGGELSRISLAIQVIVAEVLTVPSMVFDEVDTGIGGGVAEIVGKRLQTLGNNRQVLSITHLPQVAAHGVQHLHVQKATDGSSTATEVIELNNEQRVTEIARMLGGVELTSQSLAHAREMLNSAH